MPRPFKCPASSQFLDLLNELYALHQRELHNLKTQVAKLRGECPTPSHGGRSDTQVSMAPGDDIVQEQFPLFSYEITPDLSDVQQHALHARGQTKDVLVSIGVNTEPCTCHVDRPPGQYNGQINCADIPQPSLVQGQSPSHVDGTDVMQQCFLAGETGQADCADHPRSAADPMAASTPTIEPFIAGSFKVQRSQMAQALVANAEETRASFLEAADATDASLAELMEAPVHEMVSTLMSKRAGQTNVLCQDETVFGNLCAEPPAEASAAPKMHFVEDAAAIEYDPEDQLLCQVSMVPEKHEILNTPRIRDPPATGVRSIFVGSEGLGSQIARAVGRTITEGMASNSSDGSRWGKFAQDLEAECASKGIPSRSPAVFLGDGFAQTPSGDGLEPGGAASNIGRRIQSVPAISMGGHAADFMRMSMTHNNMAHLPFAAPSQDVGVVTVTWRVLLFVAVNNPIWEGIFATMILANALVMALQIQYDGYIVGREIGFGDGRMEWTSFPQFFEVGERFFGWVFTAETGLKLLAVRRRFFRDYWNVIDLCITSVWTASEVARVAFPIEAGTLRIIRLVRLLRLLRVVRMIHSFDALYLMTTALKGCVSVLGWACALLLLVQMFIALLLNQYLYDTYFVVEHTEQDVLLMFEYFGTFTRTMLSMFEITLGNWPPVCRLLSENVSEVFMLLCVVHKLIIGFAVVGVINGVFMQETFKVASIDDRIMVRQRERAIAVHRRKMNQLFAQADETGDGLLSKEEFAKVVGCPAVKTWLGSMDLDANDADTLFSLIDDGDGQLSAKELVEGVARLKGAARSIDLVVLSRDVQRALAALDDKVTVSQKKQQPVWEGS